MSESNPNMSTTEDTTTADPVDEMDRSDLEEEVKSLRRRMDQLESNSVDPVVINHLIAALTGSHDDIDDYTADPMQHKGLLEAFGDRVDRHGHTISTVNDRLESLGDIADESSTKTEKVEAIKQKARNLADDDDTEVALSARDIKGAAGCSRRYAYTLMDEDEGLPAEYEWAYHQPEKYVQRGSAESGTLRRDKTQDQALVVRVDELPGGSS